jgi:mannose-6-phosphate isomerase-like protein (cupin superfamily)
MTPAPSPEQFHAATSGIRAQALAAAITLTRAATGVLDSRCTARLASLLMETINGCTVIMSSQSAEPIGFGQVETDGAYRILVGTLPAGHPAPDFHLHPQTDEAFCVASGEITCLLGDREIEVPAGGFVFVPRGTPHTAWNSGDTPMLGLIVISPGGGEHVFEPVQAA